MAKSDLFVVVDEREERVNLSGLFKNHPDVGRVQTEMLDVGDVVVGGEIAFERKSISDFVGSIQNRRLESQIERMYDVFGPANSYVIIEGDMHEFDELSYSQFSSKSARGFVASICARWQCVPLFTSSRQNLADQITRISRKHFEDTNRVVREPQKSPTRKEADFFVKTVLQLDGVGKSKIDPLAERYDSVDELTNATVPDLKAIDGIGTKTAQSIIDQINGK